MLMSRLFDPEVVRAQIDNLKEDRERIDHAIRSLESALNRIEGLESAQTEFDIKSSDLTLHDAVKRACMNMVDGITRQRVLAAIEKDNPLLHPKSASVAASLINLSKGEHSMLRIAIEGRGRSPSYYSTQGDTVHRLGAEEIRELFEESTTFGTGGWQSLFAGLQQNFNKATGQITLTAKQRGVLYNYFRLYGSGGWQARAKRIFRRELPHLFIE
jgi:hypothetical protein